MAVPPSSENDAALFASSNAVKNFPQRNDRAEFYAARDSLHGPETVPNAGSRRQQVPAELKAVDFELQILLATDDRRALTLFPFERSVFPWDAG